MSNAGGLGILQAQFCAPPRFRAEIHRVRALTDKPFGVNLLLHSQAALLGTQFLASSESCACVKGC